MSYHAGRGRRLRSLASCGTVAGCMASGHPLLARPSQDRGTLAGGVTDYLVRGMDVLHENTMLVELTPSGAGAGSSLQRRNTAGEGGGGGRMGPEGPPAPIPRVPDR